MPSSIPAGWQPACISAGGFSQEQAQPLAEQALTKLTPASLNGIGKPDKLLEILQACSPEFRLNYPAQFSTAETLGVSLLQSVGRAMRDLPLSARVEQAQTLQDAGHDGLAYLQGALEKPGTVGQAIQMLQQAESSLRLYMAGALARNFDKPDDMLLYLRQIGEMDIQLADLGMAEFAIELDLSQFHFEARPSGVLPEEPYTILPLRRYEAKEQTYGRKMEEDISMSIPDFIGYDGTDAVLIQITSQTGSVQTLTGKTNVPDFNTHDETDLSYQTVCIMTQLLSVLPAERIPQSVEDADLILLFDQQYILSGHYELKYTNVIGQDGTKAFPYYASEQHVSVYDARTGRCLLVIDESRRPSQTLPKKRCARSAIARACLRMYTPRLRNTSSPSTATSITHRWSKPSARL